MPGAGDLVTVRIMATFDGEPIVNTLGFAVNSDFDTWTHMADELVTQLDSAIGVLGSAGSYPETRSVSYRIGAVEVVDVSPAVSAVFSRTSSAVGGITTEDAMPPNDCMCITLRSDFKGPGSRGRIYLTGWPEGAASGGFWVGEAQTQAAEIMDALLGAFGEIGTVPAFRLSILHRSSNGGVRGAPVVPLVPPEVKPVMSYTVHNEVRSLGRRAVGRRIHRRSA